MGQPSNSNPPANKHPEVTNQSRNPAFLCRVIFLPQENFAGVIIAEHRLNEKGAVRVRPQSRNLSIAESAIADWRRDTFRVVSTEYRTRNLPIAAPIDLTALPDATPAHP